MPAGTRVHRLVVALVATLAVLWAGQLGALAAPGAPAGHRSDVHGLRGAYFTTSADGVFDFAHYKSTQVDPNIDFADLEPVIHAATGSYDNVTVRWTGQIVPTYSETYTFGMIGDNGFRLWVDGKEIIDHWVDDWEVPVTSAPIALRAGHRYAVKVEFFEHFGGSNLHLSWQSASQRNEIVPNSAFYLPPDFAYDGPVQATVNTSGQTLTLRFAQLFRPLPADIRQHVMLRVNGTGWPITSVGLVPGHPEVWRLQLRYPVPRQAGSLIWVAYDGKAGVRSRQGAELGAFDRYVVNSSTYQISTPYAKDVSRTNPLPQYPRPQLTRTAWRSLNGPWQFSAGTATQPAPVGRALPERILVPFPEESQLSGIQRHDDYMWCRRTFTVPSSWKVGTSRRLLLHFGAVDWKAWVFVNGTLVTSHQGGYTGFDADVTSALTAGRNELIVKVYDPSDTGPRNQPLGKQRLTPGGIFYTGASGIWQTVWLEPVAPVHVDRLLVTSRLRDSSLLVIAATAGHRSGTVRVSAYDGRRRVATASGSANSQLRLPIPDPKLWTPDAPFLYRLEVTVADGTRIVDRVGSYTAMRSFSLGTVRGVPHMLLNGRFVFNLGTLDQGYWPDGIYTAPTDEALRSDLAREKSLGFNTVRKHTKVEPDRWYYWADRMGLIVWQDMPAMNPGRPVTTADQREYRRELTEMVEQLAGHPSIGVWVPFNEGWGEFDPYRITQLVRRLDPTRLIDTDSGTNCCASIPNVHAGDIYDDHTYVGPGEVQPRPHRAVVDGEFGGLGLPVVGHMWFGGGFAYEMENSREQLTRRYVELNREVRRLVIDCGLSASIYTQPTDVEGELNGIYTYDRKVLKMHRAAVRAVNRSILDAAGRASTGHCTSAAPE